ncbi:MAG: NmrA/HSCARG family protein [Gammaproteobacteria bacterium]|nr:NmrA/HSCARG family protein [Gammaproteobacteria bacterium]
MTQIKKILVTGATGKQGGAVARHLLQNGFDVRVLVRTLDKPEVLALQKLGAEPAQGDFDDIASLEKAMDGMDGVFSVQNFMAKNVGYDGEIRQGLNVANAAKKSNVSHFIQASIADADKAPGVRHFESKWKIEKHIDSIGLARTFLGAVFFMENFTDPQYGAMTFPLLSGVLKPQTKFHMLCVDDIGAIAAVVFANPDRFKGEKINMAGDLMTIVEMKSAFRSEVGKKPKWFKLPSWLVGIMDREIHRQLIWNNDPGWTFPISATQNIYSDATTFRDFLRINKAKLV